MRYIKEGGHKEEGWAVKLSSTHSISFSFFFKEILAILAHCQLLFQKGGGDSGVYCIIAWAFAILQHIVNFKN